IPGPRNDLPEVRLALSNDALKISGTSSRSAISRSVSATCRVSSCDSITHGPAIHTSGRPGPHTTGPMVTSRAGVMIHPPWYGADRADPRRDTKRGKEARGKPTVCLANGGRKPPEGPRVPGAWSPQGAYAPRSPG